MKKIGFKNFRRFKDFPMIELGGCTFLVGPNNSGKSTLLKAIVLVKNNGVRLSDSRIDPILWDEENNIARLSDARISNPILWDFSFAPQNGQTEHLYLGDFMSNLNDNAQEKEITFSFQSGNTDFSIVTDGSSFDEKNPSVLVDLKKITAYNSEYDIRFEWYCLNKRSGILHYTFNPKVVINYADEMFESNNKINKPLRFYRTYVATIPMPNYDTFETAYRADIDAFIAESKTADTLQTKSVMFGVDDVNRSDSDAQGTNLLLIDFLRHAKDAITSDFRSTTAYKYIETHNASNKVLLNPEDKNDYLAQTVLQYLNAIRVERKTYPQRFFQYLDAIGVDIPETGIPVQTLQQYMNMYNVKQYDAYKFVKHWMKELKIGVDFIIKPIYNEAYIVDIEGFDGNTKSIGHLGTGSIQLFILLLRIAMAISSHEKVTLYIEEPEQNLHPALQSKLAEMFYEVWKGTEGRVKFVVETHSEYLVRHTQIIAAKSINNGEYTTEEINEILKVYYFPEEGLPYSMDYRQNGYFEKPFGTGFYDASGNLARELYKIDRGL